MNMNEILEKIQNFDLHSVISELGESGHVLTQTEIIVLAAAAVAGIVIAMFGLRIVRFWAGLLGLLAGLAGGTAAAFYAGMYRGQCLELCWRRWGQSCIASGSSLLRGSPLARSSSM